VTALAARASLLKNRHALLAAQNQVSDLNAELDDALGLPLDTELDLADVEDLAAAALAREDYLRLALEQNPELRAAKETESKARSAVLAARFEYIPDIGAFARYT